MRRKAKTGVVAQNIETVTAESLLNELNTEALAFSLEQLEMLKLFLIFATQDEDVVNIVRNGQPDALEAITTSLSQRNRPIGILSLEIVGEREGSLVNCRWRMLTVWGYPDRETSEALLNRVAENLTRDYGK